MTRIGSPSPPMDTTRPARPESSEEALHAAPIQSLGERPPSTSALTTHASENHCATRPDWPRAKAATRCSRARWGITR
nr:hypothetical protein [Deltaproteobacteria bacterium]